MSNRCERFRNIYRCCWAIGGRQVLCWIFYFSI